jgi:hypothetical protein
VSFSPQAGLASRLLASRGLHDLPVVVAGKVIAVDARQHTVDVVLRDFSIKRGVPVATTAAGTRAGLRRLPHVTLSGIGQQTATGPVDVPRDSLQHDTWALLCRVENLPNDYFCVGFLYPESSELSIDEADLALDRHASGVFSLLDAAGNYEQQFPDGSFVKLGADGAPRDLAGQNYDAPSHPWRIGDDGVRRQFTLSIPIDPPVAPGQSVRAKRAATITADANAIVLTWPGAATVTLSQGGVQIVVTGDAHITASGKVVLGDGSGDARPVARQGDVAVGSGSVGAGGGSFTITSKIVSGSEKVEAS